MKHVNNIIDMKIQLTIASTMTTRPVMVCAASLRSWHKPRQARVAGEAYVRLSGSKKPL